MEFVVNTFAEKTKNYFDPLPPRKYLFLYPHSQFDGETACPPPLAPFLYVQLLIWYYVF